MRIQFSMAAIAVMLALNTAHASDLKSVAKTAIEKNPDIQTQWFAFLESLENKTIARAAYLPSVDLSAAYGKGDREFDNRSWFDQGQAEISLTQVLFDGFRISNKVKQGDYAALKRYYELNAGIEEKAFEAAKVYLDVQRYREMVQLAETNFANHQRVYNQVQQRTNQGVGNKADLSQVAGRLSLAQTNLITEKTNLNDIAARFERIVGVAPASQLAPVDLDINISADRQAVLNTAYENNYALRAALSEMQYARANAQDYKANLYPRLSFVAKHGIYQNRNSFDERSNPKDYGQDSAVELRLNYNLFNGGADRAAINSANARVLQSDDLKNRACVDIRQNAAVALNNIENYSNQLEWLKRHKDESSSVVKAYSDQYDIGRRSLLDVLDSENEAFQSNRSYLAAQYDLKIAQLQTLYITNELLPTLGIQRDNLPAASEVSKHEIISKDACTVETAAQ